MGRPRHEIDYTDADHLTHDAYIRGNADERAFTIRLDGAKRPTPDVECRLRIWHEESPGTWREVSPLW